MANKSVSWLLETLHSRILEQLEPVRKTPQVVAAPPITMLEGNWH